MSAILYIIVSVIMCVFTHALSHVCTQIYVALHVCVCVLYVGRMLLRESAEFFMGA